MMLNIGGLCLIVFDLRFEVSVLDLLCLGWAFRFGLTLDCFILVVLCCGLEYLLFVVVCWVLLLVGGLCFEIPLI